MGKKKKIPPKPLRPAGHILVNVYLFLMLGLFPVFCSDGFFKIRHDRYYAFLALTLAALVIWLLYLLIAGFDHPMLPYAVQKTRAYEEGPWYRRLAVTDRAMIMFLLVCACSTAFSDYPRDALLGTAGRNNGLVLMAVYVAGYFMVSRCGGCRSAVFAAMGITSAFVSLVAVLNFYGLDPLKMLEPLYPEDRKIFISTIGNKNLLSAYLCITVSALAALFVHARKNWLRWLSLISAGIGFAALMTADSDSGFLGFGVFTAVYLVLYAPEPAKLKKFLLVLAVMLLSARLLSLFETDREFVGLQSMVVKETAGAFLLLLTGIGTALMYWFHRMQPKARLPVLQWSLALLFGGLLAAAGAGLVYFTFVDTQTPLSGLMALLRLDDGWGTHRGFMWLRSIEIFKASSIKNKLLGTGPDTFYHVFQPYFDELIQFGDSSTNAAHNEYLNYLITVGALGAAAYLTAVVSAIGRSLRAARTDAMAPVYCAAVLCCSAQALVNISQPITTPLLILFLALCAGTKPKKKKTI